MATFYHKTRVHGLPFKRKSLILSKTSEKYCYKNIFFSYSSQKLFFLRPLDSTSNTAYNKCKRKTSTEDRVNERKRYILV